MAKIDIDQLFKDQDIEVTIQGKKYVVTEITADMLTAITAAGKEEKNVEALAKQLSIFLNVPAETFNGVDVRKLAMAASFISNELSKQFNDISKPKEG